MLSLMTKSNVKRREAGKQQTTKTMTSQLMLRILLTISLRMSTWTKMLECDPFLRWAVVRHAMILSTILSITVVRLMMKMIESSTWTFSTIWTHLELSRRNAKKRSWRWFSKSKSGLRRKRKRNSDLIIAFYMFY